MASQTAETSAREIAFDRLPDAGASLEALHLNVTFQVSNFDVAELQRLLATTRVAAVVNQVQFSPYEYRKGLHPRDDNSPGQIPCTDAAS